MHPTSALLRPNAAKYVLFACSAHPFCLQWCSKRLPEMSLIRSRWLVLNKISTRFIPNLLPVPGQGGCCRGACFPPLLTVNKELHVCQNDASGVPSETLSCYFGFGSPQSLHATIILTTDTLILFDTSTSLPHSSCNETWSASQASTAACPAVFALCPAGGRAAVSLRGNVSGSGLHAPLRNERKHWGDKLGQPPVTPSHLRDFCCRSSEGNRWSKGLRQAMQLWQLSKWLHIGRSRVTAHVCSHWSRQWGDNSTYLMLLWDIYTTSHYCPFFAR